MALSTFTLLCNHQHYSSPELFHLPKQKLSPLNKSLFSPYPQALVTAVLPSVSVIQYLAFCVWLISLSMVSSRFVHVTMCVRISFFKAE